MLWIDFGIICIGQTGCALPEHIKNIRFDVFERTAGSEPMYRDGYHFHTADQLVGMWYLAWLPEEIMYDESFFEIADAGCPCVYAVPKWVDTVKQVIEFYLQESPVHRIAVLLRVQDESNDISHPNCALDAYMKALTEGKIKWNELYFIQG